MQVFEQLQRLIAAYLVAKAHCDAISSLQQEAVLEVFGPSPEDYESPEWKSWIERVSAYELTDPKGLEMVAKMGEAQTLLKGAEDALLKAAAAFCSTASPELRDAKQLMENSPRFRRKLLELTLQLK